MAMSKIYPFIELKSFFKHQFLRSRKYQIAKGRQLTIQTFI